MRIAIKKTKVFKYEELPDDVKDTVVEKLYDINVDYEWYEGTIDWFREECERKYGITFDKAYFDLDRDNYLYFDTTDVIDSKKLLKALKKCWDIPEYHYRKIRENIDQIRFIIDRTLFAGARGRNNGQIEDYSDPNNRGKYISDYLEIHGNFENWVYDLTQELKSNLKKEYEELTTMDMIEETIRMNDYEFTEDGDLYS